MRFKDIMALVLLAIFAIGGQLFRSDGGDEEAFTPPQPNQENPRRPSPQKFAGDSPWDDETEAWLSEGPTRSRNVAPDWAGIARQAVIDIPKDRSSGTGTAFAIGPDIWLTARHVVDGCDRLGIQIADRKGIRVTDVRNHPNADVALLRTKGTPQSFAIGAQAEDGQNGYMIGFPKGQPGAVHGRKIGTTVLKERGRYRTREIADVWSERSRIPDRFDSLGGLSGGPVFTDDGRITGIVLAEERRRGRVFTAQTKTVHQMLERADVRAGTDTSADQLTPTSYPRVARDKLNSLRVAKVLCRVN